VHLVCQIQLLKRWVRGVCVQAVETGSQVYVLTTSTKGSYSLYKVPQDLFNGGGYRAVALLAPDVTHAGLCAIELEEGQVLVYSVLVKWALVLRFSL